MVAKIVIIKDDKPIDQVALGTRPMIIGRKSDCDISIKDPAVSGAHARLAVEGGFFIVEDLGSTNGIMVGGKRVERHKLNNGDTIVIGEHKLRFMVPQDMPVPKAKPIKSKAPTAPGGERVDKTQKLDRRSLPEAETAKAAPPVAPRKPVDPDKPIDYTKAHLIITTGNGQGDRIDLSAMTTVGEPGIQVAAVSRRPQGHFIIHVDGGKEKDKTPLVNGEPTGFKSRKLEPGDVIEVAGIEMEYCV